MAEFCKRDEDHQEFTQEDVKDKDILVIDTESDPSMISHVASEEHGCDEG